MKNNIETMNTPCCGCAACKVVCPVGAISYQINEDGFWTAKVDEEKCINCGKCKKVCLKAFESQETKQFSKGTLYSAVTKNEEILKQCTSGGIAYEIGKYGLENGYQIVGVVYDEKEQKAKTVRTTNLEDFEKMKGSKYIQSSTDQAFKEVIQIAKEDETTKFIVFGTPCQIYGLKMLIKTYKIKNEIILVDLFCHGVPSYLIWQQYLEFMKKHKQVEEFQNVNFRDKKYGWHSFVLSLNSEDKTYYQKAEKDLFYRAFFDNVLLDPSCKSCPVRKTYSAADIRLGDFWGKKFMENITGMSAVVAITETGKECLKNISDRIQIQEELDMEECLKSQSTHDYKNDMIYHKAMQQLKKGESLQKTIRQYRKELPKKYIMVQNIKSILSFIPYKMKIHLLKRIK